MSNGKPSEKETDKELIDEEERLFRQQLLYQKQQKQEELATSAEIENRLGLVHNTLRKALSDKVFDRETQGELGALIQLIPKIREKNNLDILESFENALSTLLAGAKHKENQPEETTSQETSSLSSRESQQLNPEQSKLRRVITDLFFINKGRTPNFIYARKIRRTLQYQLSPQSSKSTYLLFGLASFLLLLGAAPIFLFFKSQPPTLEIRPKSLSEIEIISGEQQVRIIARRENPNTGEANNQFITRNDDGNYSISFLESGELEAIIAAESTEISDAIAERLERDLTAALRQSVRREIATSIAVGYSASENTVTTIEDIAEEFVRSVVEDVETQLENSESIEIDQDSIKVNLLKLLSDELSDEVRPPEEDISEFIENLSSENLLSFSESELIDSAAIASTANEVIKEELQAFPFDSMTTPQTARVTQSSNEESSDSSNSAGDGDSGDSTEQDNNEGFDAGLEEFGVNWRDLLIVIAGGAFGGSTFIILKAQNSNAYTSEDRFSLFFTGLLKPMSGVALALFLFAALKSDALPVSLKTTESSGSQNTYLFFAISFVAGFSQLLVQDAISKTQSSVIGSSSNRSELLPPSTNSQPR